jgi:hypothetical protein
MLLLHFGCLKASVTRKLSPTASYEPSNEIREAIRRSLCRLRHSMPNPVIAEHKIYEIYDSEVDV